MKTEQSFEKWKENQLSLGYLEISNANRNRGELVGVWKYKYHKKKNTAKTRNILCTLSFEEYLYKAYEVGLTCPNQVGRVKGSYNLARYGDKGGYTVDNCRFTTIQENQDERNKHFDVSEFNRKNSKNGTNPFLYVSKKRVEEGTHHLLGTRPWNNSKATSFSLEVWYKADECYIWWKKYKGSPQKMKEGLSLKSKKACINIIKKFKEGWIPLEDDEWCSWKTHGRTKNG